MTSSPPAITTYLRFELRYESTMLLISSATRFVAYGQELLAAACVLSAPTRGSPATSKTTPPISLRLANVASLPASVPSTSFDESVRITVVYVDPGAVRDACGRGLTPSQLVAPFATPMLNWPVFEKATPRPVTRA